MFTYVFFHIGLTRGSNNMSDSSLERGAGGTFEKS